MFEEQRAALSLEELSKLAGDRPVYIVEEYLYVFNAEMGERSALLKALLPYLPLVTVVFHSKRAGETHHRELLLMANKSKMKLGLKQYKVVWEIDIEARTPAEAAEEALGYQRDPESRATHFKVIDEEGRVTELELEP